MKHSQDKRTTQKQIHTIQSGVMEINQKLQPVQDKAYQLFTEVEVQGEDLEKVVTTTEQHLEGPINDAVIHEFAKNKAIAHHQVEETRANLKAF
jgi:hypothetical protein